MRILLPAFALLLLSACQSEKVDLTMITDPGGMAISYAADVQPIFNQTAIQSQIKKLSSPSREYGYQFLLQDC